ncbi:olfactory receptor 6N1-like [Microcaecilia unicolor]|uniref:Olfactory receptor n=1 Tax=Microcaecilia unicolor TaxID=1415580 RepID=A0A6P7WN36_9AMPH|nr:olfactory receptor 6N1-like [Microcaecilia unicolor]
MENHTIVTEFIFLGFSNLGKMQFILFGVILMTYTCILIGNALIVAVTVNDSRLHSPMYFFLSNLAICGICYTTVTIPKMLADLLTEKKRITLPGCFTQLYFFFALGGTECFFLAFMAVDRYAAICNPLHYTNIMSNRVCSELAIVAWTVPFLLPIYPVILIAELPYCGPNVINHFLCDAAPLFTLACTSTYTNELLGYTLCSLTILSSFTITVASYFHIIVTVVKISSSKGRMKTFSTCVSHLTVVTIYYGTIMFMYVRPSANYSLELGKSVTVFYALLTPLLNPIIYSLRNREVKEAVKKVLDKTFTLKHLSILSESYI